MLRVNAANISQNPTSSRRLGIVRGDIELIEISAQYAESHPRTVSDLIDVPEWLDNISYMQEVAPIRAALAELEIALTNFERAKSYLIFQDFSRYYHCIKILAAEGSQEAMGIWPLMREIWAHLRGKRGPLCPVKEVVNAVGYANEIVTKYGSTGISVVPF